jgi:hypothetical protein
MPVIEAREHDTPRDGLKAYLVNFWTSTECNISVNLFQGELIVSFPNDLGHRIHLKDFWPMNFWNR